MTPTDMPARPLRLCCASCVNSRWSRGSAGKRPPSTQTRRGVEIQAGQTDHGGAFKPRRCAPFVASGGVCSSTSGSGDQEPGQSGVRKGAFGSLNYSISSGTRFNDRPPIACKTEASRHVFNSIRPRETIGMAGVPPPARTVRVG